MWEVDGGEGKVETETNDFEWKLERVSMAKSGGKRYREVDGWN
jgi:hypothetical protein